MILLCHLLQACPDAAAVQGNLWNDNPLAFCAIIRLIQDMRATSRRKVRCIALSRTTLTDSMARRLVATILGLPPKNIHAKAWEILEIYEVGRHSFAVCFASRKH